MSQLDLIGNVSPPTHHTRPDGRRTLDDYYTPPDLADAIVGVLQGELRHESLIMEPHVGNGAFLDALLKHEFGLVQVADINPEAPGLKLISLFYQHVGDYLRWEPSVDGPMHRPDVTLGNPPFSNAEAHIHKAMSVTGYDVVFLLRASILAGQGRYFTLWGPGALRAGVWPLRHVWHIVGRPSFTDDGNTDSAEYCVCWWNRFHKGPPTVDWLRWKKK